MLIRLSIASLSLLSVSQTAAWSPIPAAQTAFGRSSAAATRTNNLFATTAADTDAVAVEEEELTPDFISKLRYRELQSKLVQMGKPATGTTAQLRSRLREAAGVSDECVVNEDNMGDDCDDETAVVSHCFADELSCFCSWSTMKSNGSFGLFDAAPIG